MDPRLDMLADVIVDLAVREIETPSELTRQTDGAENLRHDKYSNVPVLRRRIQTASAESSPVQRLQHERATSNVGPPAALPDGNQGEATDPGKHPRR
jgi:hypothetical protein